MPTTAAADGLRRIATDVAVVDQDLYLSVRVVVDGCTLENEQVDGMSQARAGGMHDSVVHTVSTQTGCVSPAILGSFVASNVAEEAKTRSFPSPSLGGFGFIGVASDLSIVAGWRIASRSTMSAKGRFLPIIILSTHRPLLSVKPTLDRIFRQLNFDSAFRDRRFVTAHWF